MVLKTPVRLPSRPIHAAHRSLCLRCEIRDADCETEDSMFGRRECQDLVIRNRRSFSRPALKRRKWGATRAYSTRAASPIRAADLGASSRTTRFRICVFSARGKAVAVSNSLAFADSGGTRASCADKGVRPTFLMRRRRWWRRRRRSGAVGLAAISVAPARSAWYWALAGPTSLRPAQDHIVKSVGRGTHCTKE